MRKHLLTLTTVALLLSACSGGTGVADEEDPTATPVAVVDEPEPTEEPTEAPTEEPVVEEEPEPTPEPTEDNIFKAGETVSVTQNDEPWADITVDRVKVRKKYEGEYSDDKPKRGNVFIEARVTYKAIADGVDYNPFDWEVFVDDEAVDNWATVLNGPEDLDSGTLPAGRKASGYVVYEVPAKGKVVMSYGNNAFTDEGPVFEVVIRSK